MKRVIKLNFVVLIILLFWACSKVPTAVTTGSIEGTISDFTSGLPIGKANVTTMPPSSAVTSDSTTGLFIIDHVDPGIYSVYAEKVGFDSAAVNVSVVAEQKTIADIALKHKP